jgi:hypothetical protein
MTLNLNSYSTNLTMWKYKSVVEAGLMDSWLFEFDLLQDWERIRVFMAGMPCNPNGTTEPWAPEAWTPHAYALRMEEIQLNNPGIEVLYPPNFRTSIQRLHREKTRTSGMIVTLAKSQGAVRILKGGVMYAHGKGHTVSEFVERYGQQTCNRCLKMGHHAALCRDPATCRFCGSDHASANHPCPRKDCTAEDVLARYPHLQNLCQDRPHCRGKVMPGPPSAHALCRGFHPERPNPKLP